ncbi:MAG TPA: hypothetical protein VGN97_04945 [Mesorhizobium sp.]|nr:hypothetical protein [Mesorhizobium sp.]
MADTVEQLDLKVGDLALQGLHLLAVVEQPVGRAEQDADGCLDLAQSARKLRHLRPEGHGVHR